MKKIIAIILTAVLAVSLVSVVSATEKIGTVVGYAVPTDIVAKINGFTIESYNMNGYTYIVAEDLRYYGFDVRYDDNSRSLSVVRNGEEHINPANTNPGYWDTWTTKMKDVLYTDIVTYLNGEFVRSNNIGGKTIIRFDALSAYGEVEYNDDSRIISLTLPDVKTKAISYDGYEKDYDGFSILKSEEEETPTNSENEAVLLFEGDYDSDNATFNYDMDCDGTPEEIALEKYGEQCWKLTSGKEELIIFTTGAECILRIYGIDLDKNDNRKELAAVTAESDWGAYVQLRIFRKNDGFECVMFRTDSVEERKSMIYNCAGIYEAELYCKDGILTLSSKGKCGMWGVYDYYTYHDGILMNIEQDERELCMYDAMVKSGKYYVAEGSWAPDASTPEHENIISIYQGDEFRVVKEDNNGFVMIEKKNGETGWIYVEQVGALSYVCNEVFYVAG